MSHANPNHPNLPAPRIAIPVPHSEDREYAERAIVQYEDAVRLAGGDPVRIELDLTATEIQKEIEVCDGFLLPGSKADVDPRTYGALRHEKTDPADTKRDEADRLLLEEAYELRKPVLGICYGLQSLNVFKAGTLIQDIESKIDHKVGRSVAKAHTVTVEPQSRLSEIIATDSPSGVVAVNSSHHQSADVVGDGLRVVARCSEDGVIEALEGIASDHFVLAVQWHPERSVNDAPELSGSAQAIFRAFIEAARSNRREPAPDVELS